MLAYDWPGNVRQLRSVIRRAVLMADDTITEQHLDLGKNGGPAADSTTPGEDCGDLPLREILRRSTAHLERKLIARTLRRTGGNKSKAARLLQVDYKTLYSKVKGYGIQIEGEQPHD
jgi:DNA-binding NtrC family response regulator